MMGTIRTPYWEWWLHHNPLRRHYYDNAHGGASTCPICESDTGCLLGCPQIKIQGKFAEVKELMDQWDKRGDR